MNITDLIVELLEKGQKVVMPGIGTLDTVQRTAYHDPATHTYYPAGRAIAFSEASDEECEKLEQLRWLSAGYRITVRDTEHANIGIDTPEDLAEAEAWLAQHQR